MADTWVLELRSAQVECERLHRCDAFVRQSLFLDLPVLDSVDVVLSGPGVGTGLRPKIYLPCLKGFEGRYAIPEVDVADLVKVIEAARYGQILGPIVVDPFERDLTTGIDRF